MKTSPQRKYPKFDQVKLTPEKLTHLQELPSKGYAMKVLKIQADGSLRLPLEVLQSLIFNLKR